MPIELTLLAGSVLLGLVQIIAAAQFFTAANGLEYGASPRDAPPPGRISTLGGRLERASRNFLETFPLAAAAILIAAVAGRSNGWTVWGAQLWFWCRIAYVGLYAAGIPYARSAVWLLSVLGILMILFGLT